MAPSDTESKSEHDVPAKIGKYVIVNQIGKGSTGTVYLSHDPYYRRDVAIKVYDITEHTDTRHTRISRKMFYNEAHMVGLLQHPNLMPIYDAGQIDGKYYVVTEYIQGGRTLVAYCRPDNLLRIDDIVEIIYKCAKALDYSHSRGVIHRDIKPSNIMLTMDNDVRIIDFGIAICADTEHSTFNGLAGSPSYMSPEQVQFEPVGTASDLYSLGAVMYELLTGFRPFRAERLTDMLDQIIRKAPPSICLYRDDLPEELIEIVSQAMQKNPVNRCSSGNVMAATLIQVYQNLHSKYNSADNQRNFDLLRGLSFFHEFSQAEIWEVLRASDWHEHKDGEAIVREGEIEDRFYIIVAGQCNVEVNGKKLGVLASGDCFGETSYLSGAKRLASITSDGPITILTVSATLLEQVSQACQLRFNQVFLRSLISRLQVADD